MRRRRLLCRLLLRHIVQPVGVTWRSLATEIRERNDSSSVEIGAQHSQATFLEEGQQAARTSRRLGTVSTRQCRIRRARRACHRRLRDDQEHGLQVFGNIGRQRQCLLPDIACRRRLVDTGLGNGQPPPEDRKPEWFAWYAANAAAHQKILVKQ